jgi:hypothetical protein
MSGTEYSVVARLSIVIGSEPEATYSGASRGACCSHVAAVQDPAVG